MRFFHYILALSSCFFFFASCTMQFAKESKSPPPHKTADSEEKQFVPLNQFGPGDMLQISVYGEDGLSGLYQVSPEGSIVFPFIGEISVAELDTFTLSEKIAGKLKNGYIKNPQVTVFLKENLSKRVFVIGQVKNAGRFMINGPMTVVEAISMAGGYTPMADTSNVIITRRISGEKEERFVVNIDDILKGEKANFYLRSGDIVFVKERFF